MVGSVKEQYQKLQLIRKSGAKRRRLKEPTYIHIPHVTKTVVVQEPSISVYNTLQQSYPDTLVCKCQQALVSYQKFILSFEPTFNQICSSDFITNDWLNYVNYRSLPDIKYHLFYDFRHSAYSFFNMLNLLCQLVSSTIDDELIKFYSTSLVTEYVISRTAWNAIINASSDQFLITIANTFVTLLNSLKTTIQGNNIVNRLQTNWQIVTFESSGRLINLLSPRISSVYGGCSCMSNSRCKTTTGIYQVYRSNMTDIPEYWEPSGKLIPGHREFEVEGINVGCLILDAVLQSNLSCLYNASCLTQLYSYLHDSPYPMATGNITALNIPSSSPSLPTVEELVDHLMVDEWHLALSFESYFKECNPRSCIYTYTRQFDTIYIIKTTSVFLGGIVTIFLLAILPVVTFLRKSMTTSQAMRSRIATIANNDSERRPLDKERTNPIIRAKRFIINLNFFKDPEQETVWHFDNQRLSTRIFLVSMIMVLSFLILFTSLSYTTQTVIVNQPSIDVYSRLETQSYAKTLICPCTSILNDYKSFMSFRPIFHQLCSSIFITQRWIDYLNSTVNVYIKDFRANGLAFFPLLGVFCNLSLEIINTELLNFNSTKYATKSLQSRALFQSEAQQITSLFQQTARSSFLLQLAIFQQTMSSNALFSAWLTNYFYGLSNVTNSLNFIFHPSFYIPDQNDPDTTCSCKFTPNTCDQSSGIYNFVQGRRILLYNVPGFRIGCSIIEEMFSSSLECLFQQPCLDTIYGFISSSSVGPLNATAMIYNSTQSRYNVTTKIHDIVNNLMIEEWNNQTSFDSYFKQCNPKICTYTYDKQADMRYIIETIFGLIGGLTTIFRILLPPLVKYVRRKKRPPIHFEQENEYNIYCYNQQPQHSSIQLTLPTVSTISSMPISPWVTVDYPSVKGTYGFFTYVDTNVDDFRNIASPFFQVINDFCQLSVQTINTKLLTFKSTAFITPNLIFKQQFNVQINQFITQFIENTARSFTSTLLLNNNMTHGNMLMSALSTDSILTQFPEYTYETLYYDYVYAYDRQDQIYNSSITGVKCDCQQAAWCVQQAIVYDIRAKTALFRIPGVYVGCYMVAAVLRSDLRCFFDVECLKELSDNLDLNVHASSIVLDPNSTRYQSTSPLLEIVSNLMVEIWDNQTSYESYFNQCEPTSCIATYIARGSLIYIITEVIGLIGGLTKVYKFIVPLMVTVILQFLIPTIRRRFINGNRIIPFERNVPTIP
ncbi:hypothetical protein I4U23_027409 [Adineta vaga]|nr:hypothetical protein I4U23_027409 [Adineta vaga]